MKKAVRIALRIDDKTNEVLKTLANKLDISVGQLIRQMVKEKLNEYENKI